MATRNGTPGNDTLTGTQFADSLFGLGGNDSLLGLGGSDRLEGGIGNDTLDGGIGIDTLIGGGNNDTYIVNDINDTITEATNSGIDTVVSSISYTLGSNLENLTLTGSDVINGTGNSLNNTIIGNSGDNTLNGGAGDDSLNGGTVDDRENDILFGGDGNDILSANNSSGSSSYAVFYYGEDILYGGNGNDTLNGGEGANNSLDGGSGNDTYIVFATADTIVEALNLGKDTVQSSVSYTLGSNLENLTLTGTGAIDGTGNNLNNTIVGNAASNILKGDAGSDNLNGRAGNDNLLGSSGAVGERDTLTGGAGRDRFFLGSPTQVYYDDRNAATAGTGDYALIADLNTSEDIIRLTGRKSDYRLDASPTGLPTGTAIYRNKPTGEKDELIAILQGRSGLNLNGNYFNFTADEINLSTLNGTNGFVLEGIDIDRSGESVSGAGDVNGDGFEDFIIGAPGSAYSIYSPYDAASAGKSYVVFGKAGGFDTSLNLSTLNGSNGFTLNGDRDFAAYSGRSVSEAGDINGDGFSDILIGTNLGTSHVVFGKAEGFDASLNLFTLDGSSGFAIEGAYNIYSSGSAVSNAGDFNGDGFDDLLIKAAADQSFAEASYVVFGKAEGFGASLNLSTLNGSNGFKIDGVGYSSVSSAGDFNGDGFDDLLLGDSGADPNGQSRAGSSYVVFGKTEGFGASLNLSTLNGSNGFVINGIDEGDLSGRAVSSAGDLNGDGFNDIIIAAPGASESYVVFGKLEGFGASLNLSTLNGNNGFKINGIDTNGFSGLAVSSAGDVNSDGFDDLLIGDSRADSNGQDSTGSSYVVFGKVEGFDANFSLFDINGRNGFKINGIEAVDRSGYSVSGAGDVNGDGFDDLLVGAPNANGNRYSAGESYVLFGRDFTNSVTNTGTAGNDTLTGTAGDDILVGDLGNDRLIGGLGIDVLYGGAGDDILSFGRIDRRINGGSGTDTLRIDTSNITLDLRAIANNKITEFELIDITGTGNNSLNFTRLDLLDLSDTTNQLIVNGNAGDTATSIGQGWTPGGTTTLNGILYDLYTVGAATLLVDTDITQTFT